MRRAWNYGGRWIVACLLTVGAFEVQLESANPVRLRVSPSVAQAPATLTVVATVQKHRHNRLLRLSWMGTDGSGGSSYFQLGNRSRTYFFREIHNVSAGDYTFEATLVRGNRRSCVWQFVKIF